MKLYGADEVNGRYYLAMEYVDGIDLSKMVKEFGTPPHAGLPQYQEACGLRKSAGGVEAAPAQSSEEVRRGVSVHAVRVDGGEGRRAGGRRRTL